MDRGSESKLNEPNSFIRNPVSIRNARLKPTENKIFSVILDRSILKSLSRTNPGTNTRKIKPETCRAIGISKISVITAIACKENTNIRKFNCVQLFICIKKHF